MEANHPMGDQIGSFRLEAENVSGATLMILTIYLLASRLSVLILYLNIEGINKKTGSLFDKA